MNPLRVTAVVCTHNPNTGRLTRALRALLQQSLDNESWELLVVDNASAQPLDLPFDPSNRSRVRLVQEPRLGLSYARATGVQHARGEFVVFVDDDNVLAPDYLEQTVATFERLPRIGALGGKSKPEFQIEPEPWMSEFFSLLAVRDLGEKEEYFLPPSKPQDLREYPACAPIGAGMAVRRHALASWLSGTASALTDRSGSSLSSAGDNDIVLSILRAGWAVAYVPSLVLTHLIPARRLEPGYLARLNRGIQHSWMIVLTQYGINPWRPVSRWTVPLRKLKAWFTHRAWQNRAARIRWAGACGHFDGRAENVIRLSDGLATSKVSFTGS